MKIAYLANIRFPSERAHSTQIGHMCQAFAENGNDVTLLANKRTRESLIEVGEKFGFSPQFKMVRLRPKKIFSLIPASFVFGEFWFAVQVFLCGGLKQYDLIYTRHEWVAWLLSYFISSQKIVWESHEAKYSLSVRQMLKKKIRTVVISKGIYDFYISKGVSPEQMLIADDAIDESFFNVQIDKSTARQNLGLSQDQHIVMYIGGLSQWKGIDTFLEASKQVVGSTFAVIGGTENEVTSLQKKYPQVRFLGQRPYRELPKHQQAADVLVIPNTAKNDLSAKYTSPLKLFAHMASGVPLIISNIPSLTQVTPSNLVTTFQSDDAVDLATQISGVLNDYQSKKEKATDLIETAKNFTWRKRAFKIIAFARDTYV